MVVLPATGGFFPAVNGNRLGFRSNVMSIKHVVNGERAIESLGHSQFPCFTYSGSSTRRCIPIDPFDATSICSGFHTLAVRVFPLLISLFPTGFGNNIRRRQRPPPPPKAQTCLHNSTLAVNPVTGDVAYPAGCVVVIYQPRRNRQFR